MIEAILLAFIAAKIKKLKIKVLFGDWAIYSVLIFAVIYIFLEWTIFQGDYRFIKYTNLYKSLYLSSFIILIIKYGLYRSGLVGAIFIMLGSLLNTIVMNANDGRMPVFPTLSYKTGYVKPGMFEGVDHIHIFGDDLTKLRFLSDIFDIGYSIMSIGDIFVRLFAFLIIYQSIKHLNKKIEISTT